MFSILAEITGNLNVAVAALAVPIGIGLIGYKACESVGRNPEAAPKVLVQSIIAMAFVEAVIFFAIFLGGFAG
jgi:F-type H+-transporting ATPase subunit c